MWHDAVSISAPRGVSKEGAFLAPLFGLFFFPHSFCRRKKNVAVGDNTKRQSLSQHLSVCPSGSHLPQGEDFRAKNKDAAGKPAASSRYGVMER